MAYLSFFVSHGHGICLRLTTNQPFIVTRNPASAGIVTEKYVLYNLFIFIKAGTDPY